jgi:hypothetical protein
MGAKPATILCVSSLITVHKLCNFLSPPQRSCRGVYWFQHVRPSVDKSYAVRYFELCFLESFKILSAVYWWREEIPFIFDDFHFWRSSVIGLDMTENRIFTLCHMIIWVVFLGMFSNFISSLPVKRGGSLSFLTIFTFAVPELLNLIWQKIGFLPCVVW